MVGKDKGGGIREIITVDIKYHYLAIAMVKYLSQCHEIPDSYLPEIRSLYRPTSRTSSLPSFWISLIGQRWSSGRNVFPAPSWFPVGDRVCVGASIHSFVVVEHGGENGPEPCWAAKVVVGCLLDRDATVQFIGTGFLGGFQENA